MSNIYLEVAARQAYDRYLRLCIEHPELASFELAQSKLGVPAADKIWVEVSVTSEKYLWFLSYMLHVFDDLLSNECDTPRWHKVLSAQLEYHREPLASIWTDEWETEYSKALAKLVMSVVNRNAV